ncbi:MAG: DNA methyltransferase [Bacteroidales bacterium]|nr:DNA methyltransferase [Bacteroidales bacterium]
MFEGLFGIEKENIRINQDARISKKAHDNIFRENNSYIIRDFSESQIEMITSPHKSVLEAYNELHNINHIVISTLKDAIVLDPFNGSGTTGVAAKILDRRYIGIDNNKDYLDLSIRRINAERKEAKGMI